MLDTRTLPVVLLLALFAAAPVSAENVIFQNDCRLPVVVQVTSVQRGVMKRDQCVLRPGEATVKISLDANKIFTIYCGKTGRTLYRDALRMSSKPLQLSIMHDPWMPTRVRVTPVLAKKKESPPPPGP